MLDSGLRRNDGKFDNTPGTEAAAIMRITDIEADIVRIPLSARFSGSVYQIDSRCTIVVRVHTDAGLSGEIYSGDERTGYRLLKDLVTGPMRDAVIGEDPAAIERCWQKMFALTPRISDKAIAMRAVAAVDIALWDIAGKALGVPVRQLLGGYSQRAPLVRFAYYVQGRDTDDMVQDLLYQRERGIGGVKLKVGGIAITDDLLRVRAIRDALGDDFIIVCDANQAWTLDEALEFAYPAKELGLAWLEEPCRWQNADQDMRQVRLRTGIPVAAGQGESSSWGGQRLMDAEAVDILNIDAAICGGISEWRRVAGAAQMRGLQMAHHEEPQLAVQLLPAHAHGLFVEVFEEERDPVYYRLNSILPEWDHGEIIAPAAPGMGLQLDAAVLEEYKVY